MLSSVDKKNTSSCFSRFFVILFIPFLFLLGLVLAYFGVLSLKVELHTLIIITFIFITFSFFVKHNASYSACHMKGTFSHMEDDLHYALKSNALTIMGKTKSTLHVKEFIAEYYNDIRNDNFARVASSVFPMLGILGTFIAIAGSMPDFSAQNTESLDHEISVLLSGIGTAFYASIYGIMLSLLWTYFEKRGLAKIDKQILELEKIYGSRVWQKFELLKHEHMRSELKDQEIVQTLKETFNMDFIKELNNQYLQNFSKIMEDTSSHFTELTAHLQEASTELKESLEYIQHKGKTVQAVATMQESIEGFNTNALNLQKSMERFDGSVDHTFDTIDKELSVAVDKLSTFARIISEQNQLILNNMATFKKQEKEEN
ncbi:MAG: MotA/TolQ/ExbB proton channel family protein [Sulfurovum sp.]|nr:MotA/TolQ/ExbB proton channel family protein [Sulfurovum sp.]